MAACAGCAADLPAGSKFCPECGLAVAPPRACPSCGTPAETGRFCKECGTSLDGAAAAPPAPTGSRPVSERRVTSVLFGDLVGFTPLSESRDPEEVRELLSTYFERCRVVIGRYGGTVEKFIGDAVMAVWGVPVAHEDDAERAVRAGLDLVSLVASLGSEVGAPGLAMRVGVVTGEVAVTVGATGQGMVAGDAVNTAARVQTAAAPGRVWVDDATRALSGSAISFDDTGEHPLKGKAEPVQLWQAVAVVGELGGGARVDGLEAPLIGRSAELRLLKDLFHATEESGRPRMVLLDGAAGSGKSRMTWEFEKYVDGITTTTRWHRSRCLSYGDAVAFWALSEAMRARFGLVEGDSGDVVPERLEQGLAAYVDDPEERDWLRPRLAVLLGAASGTVFSQPDLFAAWTAWLGHLSTGGNTVALVVDDAQHADDGLLDFLDHLLATGRAPVFVVLAARPELLDRRPDLGGRRTTVVRLDPLEDEPMAELVDGLVSGLPPSARAALVQRSEGVPLFAVEMVRALVDRDLVVPSGGRYVAAPGADLDVAAVEAPASLQALVAARLDALTAEERRVVTDASVLGATFSRESLVALGQPAEVLDPALSSLVRKEILTLQVDRFSAELGQYRFVQSVVRQVAYGTQSRRDRKARHLMAADHLAGLSEREDELAVVVARHLLDAVDASGPDDSDVSQLVARAVALLERAAQRAVGLGAPVEALQLIETALARTSDDETRARLHLMAAKCAGDATRLTESIDHATAATETYDALQQPLMVAQAVAVHAEALMDQGEASAGLAVARAGYDAVRELPGSERARLPLLTALARSSGRISTSSAEHLEWLDELIRLADAIGEVEALANAYVIAGVRYTLSSAPVSARAAYGTAVAIAREHHLLGAEARALTNAASMLLGSDPDRAVDDAVVGMELTRRAGLKAWYDIGAANAIAGCWLLGRYAELRQRLEVACEETTDAEVKTSLGLFSDVVESADGGPRLGEDVTFEEESLPARIWLSSSAVLRAVAGGRGHEVDELARVAGQAWRDGGYSDDYPWLLAAVARATVQSGRLETAAELIAPVEDLAPGQVGPVLAAFRLQLRGLLGAARGDDPDLVEDELRRAVEQLDALRMAGERARTQEDLGRLLAQQGRADEAAELLDAAAATYADCGATRWLALLEAWRSEHLLAARSAS